MRPGPWVVACRWTDVLESLRQKILKLNKTYPNTCCFPESPCQLRLPHQVESQLSIREKCVQLLWMQRIKNATLQSLKNKTNRKLPFNNNKTTPQTKQSKTNSHFYFNTQHHLNLAFKNTLQGRHLLKLELECFLKIVHDLEHLYYRIAVPRHPKGCLNSKGSLF